MEEIIAWFITGIFVFIIGCVCGRSTNRRAGTGTGSNFDRAQDSAERAGDDNRQLRDDVRKAGDNNQRAQDLVGRAREILSNARHTDSGN